MRYLILSSLVFITPLPGCSLYYESQADDMVERQMDAMVFVEGGEFMMGNPGGWSVRSDTIPAHRVVLDDFHIQKYEVTQGDFELFMAMTDYEPSNEFYEKRRSDKPNRYRAELPAVASWKDADKFCRWLGKQSGTPIQLPTEAQWEYAARSGGKMWRYATENGEAVESVTMAKRPSEYRNEENILPKPPGSFPPNPLGLYDMSGNAAEWVQDYYGKTYYENSPIDNPTGPKEPLIESWSKEPYRVVRGGDFKEFAGNTTVTRRKAIQSATNETISFRCGHGGLMSTFELGGLNRSAQHH